MTLRSCGVDQFLVPVQQVWPVTDVPVLDDVQLMG